MEASNLSLETRIVPAEGVEWTDAGGEIVLLEPKSGLVFGLNESSSLIWRCLVGGSLLGNAVDSLIAEYDVQREAALIDVRQFVNLLLTKGLVQNLKRV